MLTFFKKHKLLRYLILFLILPGCLSRVAEETPEVTGPLSPLYNPALKPFYHGVASGDPLSDAVIIWTRVHAESSNEVTLLWQVSEDSTFQNIVKSGGATAEAANDHTVKVDVTGLQPGQTYFYRFKSGEIFSPVGRTRTLPVGATKEAKFAVVSCSNWEFGYFNPYKHIANRDDINAVLHLGDYIYEYGVGTYGDTTIGRFHEPPHEIISLEDYRTRYSQYRLDKDLQAIHQMHPFIAVWDDHEIANNAYKTGAQNHQPEEGSYEKRKKVATKVYYEWMPVREDQEHYRSFQFGDMAQLIMLDERLAGRTEPADDTTSIATLPPDHTMLGEEQLNWFLENLEENDERWQLIGNQVVFSYLNYGRPDFNINPDSWDGYPLERKEIVDFIKSKEINNVIFLTGDTHASWAFEVTPNPFVKYDSVTGIGAMAVEFGAPSVNSGNADERFPADSVKLYEKTYLKPLNPHLKYVNMRDHGYMLITLNRDEVKAEWYFVDNFRDQFAKDTLDQRVKVNHGEHKIHVLK
ncbi:MAG: alkaline phosphatase D family protein [Candidatus Cyclobacteriaceae bacterium M2_1C_046]